MRGVTEEGDGGEVVRAGPSFLEEVTTEVVLNGPLEGHCVQREQSVQVPGEEIHVTCMKRLDRTSGPHGVSPEHDLGFSRRLRAEPGDHRELQRNVFGGRAPRSVGSGAIAMSDFLGSQPVCRV